MNKPAGAEVAVGGDARYNLIDPSENVKALNKASGRHLREILKMEVRSLRREIESQARLVSKTRKIDRQNQRQIDERLEALIEKVSTTIELTAKTLSGSVVETAKTLASSHESNFGRLSEKVAAVERVQNQGTGQAGERDPQIKALMAEVAALRAAQLTGTGKGLGLSLGWSLVVGGVGLVVSFLTIIGAAIAIYVALSS